MPRVLTMPILVNALLVCAAAAREEPNAASPQREFVELTKRMLEKQRAQYESTKQLDELVQKAPDKMPRDEDRQAALKLADGQGEISKEATRIIELLEAQNSTIAFPEAYRQLREDIKRVQTRLKQADTGATTQDFQQDIIESLVELISDLGKH